MDGGQLAALRNLCAIFRIPQEATAPAPDIALQPLLHVYGMPLIRSQPARRDYGNQILAATQGHFDVNSTFVRLLGGVVIMMQEFPYQFTNLFLSNADLISRYRSLASRNPSSRRSAWSARVRLAPPAWRKPSKRGMSVRVPQKSRPGRRVVGRSSKR